MPNLIVERNDGVVRVTLNRPERLNAVPPEMWPELTAVFAEVTRNPDDRVLVITGAGRGFCSGADLAAERSSATRDQIELMRSVGRCAVTLHGIPKPTIAAVNGAAVGAGCNLALACDLVIASDAARFSEIFVQRGLSIDFAGSYLLPRLIGLHRAKELALLAEIISAAEAERIGLVNKVVPAARLDEAIAEITDRLLQLAPIALSQTKKLLNHSFSMTIEEAVDAEGAAQVVNRHTLDTAEASRAFTEKREPKFTGE